MQKTLGQRIRELRGAEDYSLREFAAKIGVTPAHLSDVELGRRFPSPDLLKRIASNLKVSGAELEAYDSRPPVEDIKRLSEADPAFGFAFRKLVDEMKDKNITPEQLVKSLNRRKRDPE